MPFSLWDLASQLAEEVLSFQRPADAVLSYFFRHHSQLGRTDRAFMAESIFTLLRHYEKIQTLHPKIAQNPRLAILMAQLLRGFSISALQKQASLSEEEINLLKAFKETDFSGSLNTLAELPDWLIDCLHQQGNSDQNIVGLGQALNQQAPLDVRVNTLKMRRDAVYQQLQEEGFQVALTPYSPWGIRFFDKPALNQHSLFKDGVLEVQDEGSQLLAYLSGAKRQQIAVDFCAGAGGKTLAMGAMMQNTGRLYAFDVSEKRLQKLKPRMAKSGLSNITPQLIANENDGKLQKLYGKCDTVLIDAPCSGLGTLRRNPDLKYRQSQENIQRILIQQASIFQAASHLVRIGGRLVYATCSILNDENEKQVEAFLQNHPHFELLDVRNLIQSLGIEINQPMLKLNPITHQTDGFFAAALIRKQ